MKTTYYKVLNPDRGTIYGRGQWPMPGEWLEAEGELIPCENGLHLCRKNDLIHWLGPEIWTAEYKGERVDSDNKIVVRKSRLIKKLDTWNERTQRLFACDCAEHVLHLFESQYPEDKRLRKCIEVSRLFAEGKATKEELRRAGDAARAARAAGDTAGDTAGSVWYAAWSVWYAAGDTAWYAAGDAAWSVWYAARDTARDTARAAGVAWDAAWSTAREAAGSAWDAEKKWQTEKLFEYLED